MKYYLDTEFNGMGGALLSLALVADDGRELYFEVPFAGRLDAWVAENVVPKIDLPGARPILADRATAAWLIQKLLEGDPDPVIVADWPDDIAYFCRWLITGPGLMVKTADRLSFVIERVDAYPAEGCALAGAVQHNALWDARALRHVLS